VNQAERSLWIVQDDHQMVQCIMRSCCAGAELQVLTMTRSGIESTVLRELYPSKSDLYERARLLEAHYRDEMGRRHKGAEEAAPADLP
jgi:hypothetical protein